MSKEQALPGTIYALSTGGGTAGIAVVRVSGPASGSVVSALCGPVPAPRQATLRAFRDPQTLDLIDRGLVLWFPGPKSFNGEDIAEFHVHGSRAVVDALLRALGSCPDTRMAEPGEFALRAFRNGRIDLTEAEALSDLLAARTEAQRQQALRLAGGAARALADGWRHELLSLLARVEAAVDFVDEAGVAEAAQAEIGKRLDVLIGDVEQALRNAARGEAIRDGIKVVIAGPPNAGKSSLLNFLAGREAAIVSARPGTTRDVIEVSMDMAGLPVIFTDTAGLRDGSTDEIEQIGMERSRREIAEADIVIWMTAKDSEQEPYALIDSKTIWVENKVDLPESSLRLFRNDPDYRVSVKSGDGMATLLNGLKTRIESAFGETEPALIVRARQRECIETLLERLKSAQIQPAASLELVAEDLRAAADALGRLTGKINVEDILGEIFSEFCIGK